MVKIIGFDIETVPLDNLSQAQLDFLDKRLEFSKDNDSEKIKGTNPYLGKIVCIGLGEIVDKKIATRSLIGEEKEILEKFWEIMGRVGPATFVSFNGLNFDIQFILIRTIFHGIRPTNQQFLDKKKFQLHPHFDIMQLMANWSNPFPSLDLVCDFLGVKTPKDGAIAAKDVAKAYKDGRIKEIAEYCEKDVKATLEVYLKIKDYFPQNKTRY
jgi:predicted PolB exonuclease-like 3'-5' exonuclease